MHVGNGIITSDRVEAAMKAVDRKDFCSHNSYYDSPQQIGEGQLYWVLSAVVNKLYSMCTLFKI